MGRAHAAAALPDLSVGVRVVPVWDSLPDGSDRWAHLPDSSDNNRYMQANLYQNSSEARKKQVPAKHNREELVQDNTRCEFYLLNLNVHQRLTLPSAL